MLSLAPPPHKEEQTWDFVRMAKYVMFKIMDGEPVFRAVREQYPDTIFLRIRPSLPESSEFKMDEKDAKKMKEAMDQELEENDLYRNQIKDSAGIIAARMINDFSKDHIEMIKILVKSMKNRQQYNEALFLARAVLERIPG